MNREGASQERRDDASVQILAILSRRFVVCSRHFRSFQGLQKQNANKH